MQNQQKLLNEFLEEWQKGNGVSVRTSGSTGAPKNIILPHDQIVRSALRSNRFFGIQKDSLIHSAISFQYIGGKMMIARSLISGCSLSYSKPSVIITLEDIDRPVKLVSAVPAQMNYVVENPDKYASVEQFLIGGSAISNNLWDMIVASGIKAWESYGMTETATHIGMRRISGSATSRPRFVPLKGVSISSRGDGCLNIKDGDIFVSTTDLVTIYPDSSFEILGRKDDVIITGGLKVMPQELESRLHPYIDQFFSAFYISSVPDDVWTSRLILVGVPEETLLYESGNDGLEQIVMDSLHQIPEDKIPRRLLPKEIKLVEALPVTSSGKLYRKFKFED